MYQTIIELNRTQRTKDIPELRTGDVVRVHRKIIEGDKKRIQVFEGTIISIKGGQSSSPMMTIRKIGANNIGVEIIVPAHSPAVDKIELVKRTKTRRSKLYFVRDKSKKELRKKLKEIEVKAKVASTPTKEAKSSENKTTTPDPEVVEVEKVEETKAE